MEIKITLYPKQREFLNKVETTLETLYGGAKGGGKSGGMRRILLLRRFKYPGSHGALFRRTYPEIYGNHIKKMFEEYPELRQYWSEKHDTLNLPNRSSLKFAHCQHEKDLEKHQGQEYNDLAIEEAGEWPESMYSTLKGSNRSSVPGIKPRILLSGNPGGIGHGWLKRLFVERRYKGEERPEDYAFVQAKVEDNPSLWDNDPDYVRKLNSNPNLALRRAYRDGDWNIFAGQFFQEISRDVHFIKPFNIPPHWNRFGAYDFGFNHPAAFGWFANDEDGNTYLYREFVRAQLRVDQFTKEINEYPDTQKCYPIVAGHDCWTQKSVLRDTAQPPTVAEEFQSHGILLKRAVIDRIQGAAHLRSYLALRGEKRKPRFFIFDTCPIAFDAISRMIHDPDRVEDVLKVDATEGDPLSGDDAYDMVRYGLMSRPAITDPIKAKPPVGSREWYLEQNNIDWEREQEKMIEDANGGWPEQPTDTWNIRL